MAVAAPRRTNGSQSRDRGVVKPRMTWEATVPFPENPMYEGRLRQMEREWGGYAHSIVGSPAIFDNSANAFPEYPLDTLFVGDGNHRRELARRHKKLDQEFVAELYRGLSRAEMFNRRRGLNDRRTVRPSERFLALAEENKLGTEAQIKDAVEGLGWRISHQREEQGIPFVNELMWVWKRDKGAMVRAIQTYETAFGTKAAWNGQGLVLKGLGAFWIKYPDADPDRLVRSLNGVTVTQLYDSGRSQRNAATFIKSVHDGVRYSLAMGYNRAGRKGRLPL